MYLLLLLKNFLRFFTKINFSHQKFIKQIWKQFDKSQQIFEQQSGIMGNCAPANVSKKFDNTKKSHKLYGRLLSAACSSMKGWREQMQDAHVFQYPFNQNYSNALFGVFDGHRGSQVAIYASQRFSPLLRENQNFKNEKFQEALKEVFQQLDEEMQTEEGKKKLAKIKLQQYKLKNGKIYVGNKSAGCTAIVCLIVNGIAYLANAGDCRAVGYGLNKQIYQLNKQHKPASQEESERIEKAGGWVMHGRISNNLNVSRGLGDFDYKVNKSLPYNKQIISCQPQIQKIQISKLDYLIMGCDGIWQTLSNQQMGSQFQNVDPNFQVTACESLLDKLISQDQHSLTGKDNMSVMYIKFH